MWWRATPRVSKSSHTEGNGEKETDILGFYYFHKQCWNAPTCMYRVSSWSQALHQRPRYFHFYKPPVKMSCSQRGTLMEKLPKQSIATDWHITAWTIEQIWLKVLCISCGLACKVSQSHNNVICASAMVKAISLHNSCWQLSSPLSTDMLIPICAKRRLTSAERFKSI